MLHENTLYLKSALLYYFFSHSKIQTGTTLARHQVCLEEGWEGAGAGVTEAGGHSFTCIKEGVNGNRELSPEFNLNPSPESRCIKNGTRMTVLELAAAEAAVMERAPGDK